MAHSPFGLAVAVCGGRYLGAWLDSVARDALSDGARWKRAAQDPGRAPLRVRAAPLLRPRAGGA
eukprot:8946885-Lingulodinium_polyedra.AAC.1